MLTFYNFWSNVRVALFYTYSFLFCDYSICLFVFDDISFDILNFCCFSLHYPYFLLSPLAIFLQKQIYKICSERMNLMIRFIKLDSLGTFAQQLFAQSINNIALRCNYIETYLELWKSIILNTKITYTDVEPYKNLYKVLSLELICPIKLLLVCVWIKKINYISDVIIVTANSWTENVFMGWTLYIGSYIYGWTVVAII